MSGVVRSMFILLLVHKVMAGDELNPKGCVGENEEFTLCGSRCPETCQNVREESKACITLCAQGCFCREGFIRDEETKKCIPKADCPGVCGENEQYSTCGTACPKTCQNLKEPQVCVDMCVQGCFCRDDFVRDNVTNKCVPIADCPKLCGNNEQFVTCGSACPVTCKNMNNPPKVCTLQCLQRVCECKKGFVYDGQTGKCVSPKYCTAPCYENEIFMASGEKRCEYKCNGARKCRYLEDAHNNCLCKPNFYRDLKTLKCLTAEECRNRTTRY